MVIEKSDIVFTELGCFTPIILIDRVCEFIEEVEVFIALMVSIVLLLRVATDIKGLLFTDVPVSSTSTFTSVNSGGIIIYTYPLDSILSCN